MAWRLEDYLLEGYFHNVRRNSTTVTLRLRGFDEPLRLELTGDAGPMLQGRAFEFRRRTPPPAAIPDARRLRNMQIGPTGTMVLRMVKTFRHPLEEVLAGTAPKDFDWKPCLYLEWFSQNGHMVLEVLDPEIELREGEPIPTPEIPNFAGATPQVTVVSFDEDGEPDAQTYEFPPSEQEVEEEAAPDDGQEPELEEYLAMLNSETERAYRCDKERRILEMEDMEPPMPDENSEYIAGILTPQHLPAPFDVDEETAEGLVKTMLAQMAMHSIAVHLCEHCTQRQAYEYLVRDIIHEGRVPGGLASSGWTQNYSYSESCPECEAEMEKEFGNSGHEPPAED